MKYLLLFLAFSSTSFADQITSYKFDTTGLSWCNGPSNGDSGACQGNDVWNAVELKNLKGIDIRFSDTEQFLRLEDKYGHIWQQDLIECNAQLGSPEGCSRVVDLSNPNKIQVTVDQWHPDQRPARFMATIEGQNQLYLLGPNNSQLTFGVKRREEPK